MRMKTVFLILLIHTKYLVITAYYHNGQNQQALRNNNQYPNQIRSNFMNSGQNQGQTRSYKDQDFIHEPLNPVRNDMMSMSRNSQFDNENFQAPTYQDPPHTQSGFSQIHRDSPRQLQNNFEQPFQKPYELEYKNKNVYPTYHDEIPRPSQQGNRIQIPDYQNNLNDQAETRYSIKEDQYSDYPEYIKRNKNVQTPRMHPEMYDEFAPNRDTNPINQAYNNHPSKFMNPQFSPEQYQSRPQAFDEPRPQAFDQSRPQVFDEPRPQAFDQSRSDFLNPNIQPMHGLNSVYQNDY